MMRASSLLKIGCASIFAIGLLGECTTAVYDETTNERLRRQYTQVREDVIHLEYEIELYERRLHCIKHPGQCEPVRIINGSITSPLEIQLGGEE